MDPAWMTLIVQLGLPAALVIFFIKAGDAREKRMSDRLDNQADAMRTLQSGVIQENTRAMNSMAESSRETTVLLREMSDGIKSLYCAREWDGSDRRKQK